MEDPRPLLEPIPQGIEQLLKLGQVAEVLNISYSKVKYWTDLGQNSPLPFIQERRSAHRLVRAQDLQRFALERDLVLDWGALLE